MILNNKRNQDGLACPGYRDLEEKVGDLYLEMDSIGCNGIRKEDPNLAASSRHILPAVSQPRNQPAVMCKRRRASRYRISCPASSRVDGALLLTPVGRSNHTDDNLLQRRGNGIAYRRISCIF